MPRPRLTRQWPVSDPKPDRHTPASVIRPEPRMAGTYDEPDPDIDVCPACTQVWVNEGWQHDPACLFRLATPR